MERDIIFHTGRPHLRCFYLYNKWNHTKLQCYPFSWSSCTYYNMSSVQHSVVKICNYSEKPNRAITFSLLTTSLWMSKSSSAASSSSRDKKIQKNLAKCFNVLYTGLEVKMKCTHNRDRQRRGYCPALLH